MSFHPETIARLSGSLQKYSAELEDARDKLAAAQSKVDERAAIVADCLRFLDFAELCDRDADLAHAFANAVLNRDGEPTAPASSPLAYAEAVNANEEAPRTGQADDGLPYHDGHAEDVFDPWCPRCKAQRAELLGFPSLTFASTWADPAVRRAVRETIEGGAL